MAAAQVIIAEDEAQLRDLLSEVLTDSGLTVRPAADGIEALALLEQNPGVSLLLSDVRMPRMDGYSLVEAALKLRPELKIVMLTAYAHDHPTPAALQAREIRVLIKPVKLDRLAALVGEMLGRA